MFSPAPQLMKPSNRIMMLSQEDKMEHSDDDSYVLIDSEDFAHAMTSSEEDSSVKSEPYKSGMQSSDVDTESDSQGSGIEPYGVEINDTFNMGGIFQFITIAYQEQKDYNDACEFPAHIKRKEDMQIKDVIKDHALPFLPAKSLLRFRAVSKEWDKWITNPFLAHKQSYFFQEISGFFCQDGWMMPAFITLKPSAYGVPSPSLRFLPEFVVIRSSCNGLLLCQGCGEENVYYICNPVTKEWEMLPLPGCYHGPEPAIVLVFEPSVLNMGAHYHLICAIPLLDQPIIRFEIYSSETKSWKCSATDCVELGNIELKNDGFYMKGVIYWETTSRQVLAFDLKNELCGILPLPSKSGPHETHGALTRLHGELCYIDAYYKEWNLCSIDIYGGMDMNLKHSIAVQVGCVPSLTGACRVLPSASDEIVMILTEGVLYSYHVREKKVEVLGGSTRNDFMARYLPYVNSLVSVGCK